MRRISLFYLFSGRSAFKAKYGPRKTRITRRTNWFDYGLRHIWWCLLHPVKALRFRFQPVNEGR